MESALNHLQDLDRSIDRDGPLAFAFSLYCIHSLHEALEFVRDLSYGRNANRHDFSLVLTEKQGTCSSKHALIKALAEEQGWDDIELVLCIYRMQAFNTPGIGQTLEGKINFIPEAHCYLTIGGEALDITSAQANIQVLAPDILTKQSISAEQVNTYKVQFHQEWIKAWIERESVGLSFDSIWQLRETCIKRLAQLDNNPRNA